MNKRIDMSFEDRNVLSAYVIKEYDATPYIELDMTSGYIYLEKIELLKLLEAINEQQLG